MAAFSLVSLSLTPPLLAAGLTGAVGLPHLTHPRTTSDLLFPSRRRPTEGHLAYARWAGFNALAAAAMHCCAEGAARRHADLRRPADVAAAVHLAAVALALQHQLRGARVQSRNTEARDDPRYDPRYDRDRNADGSEDELLAELGFIEQAVGHAVSAGFAGAAAWSAAKAAGVRRCW